MCKQSKIVNSRLHVQPIVNTVGLCCTTKFGCNRCRSFVCYAILPLLINTHDIIQKLKYITHRQGKAVRG